MKYFILFILLVPFKQFSQTREADYNYIINHYMTEENNPKYKMDELSASSFKKGSNLNVTLQFVNFISDKKNRGVAVVYQERKTNNELIKRIVLCLPDRNSSEDIHNKAFAALNDIDDMFIIKYIFMGLIRIGINL